MGACISHQLRAADESAPAVEASSPAAASQSAKGGRSATGERLTVFTCESDEGVNGSSQAARSSGRAVTDPCPSSAGGAGGGGGSGRTGSSGSSDGDSSNGSGSGSMCGTELRAVRRMWKHGAPPAADAPAAPAPAAAACKSSQACNCAGNSSAAGLARSNSGGSLDSGGTRLPVPRAVEGLRLGGLIGRGSYGRVYRGSYFGTKVAVKVIDDADVLARDQGTGESLEATLSTAVAHPHIVHTLKCAVVTGFGQLPSRPAIQTLDVRPRRRSLGSSSTGVGFSTEAGSSAVASSSALPSCAASAPLASAPPASAPPAGASIGLEGSSPAASPKGSGQTWIIMEYQDRGSLQNALDNGWLRIGRRKGEPADLLAALATARDIAAGMLHLHSLGILHGDLSAHNVMLSSCSPDTDLGRRDFRARVADFGLARRLEPSESVVHTNHYGTITHMPPELLRFGCLSKAADVFAFGVLLWQMWTGLRPWEGLNHAGVARAVLAEGRTLEFPPGTPAAIAALGSACMAPDAAARPRFHDILDVLEPLAELEAEAEGVGLLQDL